MISVFPVFMFIFITSEKITQEKYKKNMKQRFTTKMVMDELLLEI